MLRYGYGSHDAGWRSAPFLLWIVGIARAQTGEPTREAIGCPSQSTASCASPLPTAAVASWRAMQWRPGETVAQTLDSRSATGKAAGTVSVSVV